MKRKPKFKPDTPIIWNKMKGKVVSAWYDGNDMRYEIYVSKADHRGLWITLEDKLEEDMG